MINTDSVAEVDASQLNAHFGKPLYDTYGFAQIPQTIAHLLTGEGAVGLPDAAFAGLPRRYKKVVLLLIDGFGWRFFEKYQEKYPFLSRFVQEGVVSKLTTQFPSTTAAHVTTMHTGLPVGESGVYEWFYYEPLLDSIISPLLFSFAGDKPRDTLRKTGITAKELLPSHTLYQQLAQSGVRSTIFQNGNYTPSSYSDVVFAGARIVGYKTLSEALINLTEAVSAASGPAYFFLYADSIDMIGHHCGPSSRQFEAEVDTIMTMLERLLHTNLAGNTGDTLLLLTADHGQIEVSPETVLYLNHLLPSIASVMKTNREGRPLVPAGSARDMFLHIREEALDETHALLTQQLEGRAEVYRVSDLIAKHYFSAGPPSETFLNRVGNLVILPYKYDTVWWHEPDRFEQKFLGHHGGLTREEMETELLALPYL